MICTSVKLDIFFTITEERIETEKTESTIQKEENTLNIPKIIIIFNDYCNKFIRKRN
jgi:hypothetical protein